MLRQLDLFDAVECFVCGSGSDLHVHHVNFSHQDDSAGNRVALCARCHKHIHRDFGFTDRDELARLRALVRFRREFREAGRPSRAL
jgi:hypothetical protein